MNYRWIFIVGLLIGLGGVLPAQAQWSTDPAINNPISTASSYQWFPTIVSDGAGGAILTWPDQRSGDRDVYAQRINASGFAQWTNNGLPISTGNGDQWPTIVSDGVGGAILTWSDQRSGYYNTDIYAQRVNANGVAQWVTAGVPICTASGNQFVSTIVSDGAGGAIITWRDERNGSYDIYAQQINASGFVQWASDGVAVSVASHYRSPITSVSDGMGGVIITWLDSRSSSYDIYAQRINASGVAQWTIDGVPISIANRNQLSPTMINDGSGGAIITWMDSRNSSGLHIFDIYAQRINASGVAQWATDGVPICTDSGGQQDPTIVSDGAGGAIITWWDSRGGHSDIYAQRIDGSGVAQWTTDGAPISMASRSQLYPTLVSDGAGGAVITWEDSRSGTNWDIYAQRINASGAAQWASDGVPISTASGGQYSPTLVSDGAGGAIITWVDLRSGNYYDIYAQRVRSDGTLGGNEAPVADAGADQTVIIKETVQLTGSGSSDPDGNPLTYSWEFTSKPAGSLATLSDPSIVNPTFVADKPGEYRVSLTVNDGIVNSAPDEIRITVLTPSEAAQSLKGQVEALIAAGVLTKNGNGLLGQLDAILAKLNDGKTDQAINQLGAFVNHVADLVATGVLTPAQGQPLIETANRIIAALGG
jgi:hypothetical protein